MFGARRVYSCGRTVVNSCRTSSRFYQSIKHFLLGLYGVLTVGVDGGRFGVPSELRDCMGIEMTSKTLNSCFSTRRVGKVPLLLDFCLLDHSFDDVGQSVSLQWKLLILDVLSGVIDGLQIKFADTLWSMA